MLQQRRQPTRMSDCSGPSAHGGFTLTGSVLRGRAVQLGRKSQCSMVLQRLEPNGLAKNGCGIDCQLLTRVVSVTTTTGILSSWGGQLLLAKFPAVHVGIIQVAAG